MLEMILYGVFFLYLSRRLYKSYVFKQVALTPLLAASILIGYGVYLQAVSPYSRPLAFGLYVILSVFVALVSTLSLKPREEISFIYSLSISSLFFLASFPEPIYLFFPLLLAYLVEIYVFTLMLSFFLLYFFLPENKPLIVYKPFLVALSGIILGAILTKFGSFKAPSLESVLPLDLAAGILYALLLGFLVFVAYFFFSILSKLPSSSLSIYLLRTLSRLDYLYGIALPAATVIAYFFFPPLALIPIVRFIIERSDRAKPSAYIAYVLLIAFALLTPNLGAKAYTIELSSREDYPITIDHLRLIDRPLFIDIVTTGVRLNVTYASVELVPEAANVGLVDGRPLYIMPFVVKRYSEENNFMLGYVALPLDRPVPEAAIVKYVSMSVAPGLLGLKDLKKYVESLYGPRGYNVTEYYLIDDEEYARRFSVENPFRVVLLEKLNGMYPVPASFVLLVDKDAHVKRVSLELPQSFSSYTAFKMLLLRGKNQRNREVDYTAQGALRIPQSATLISELGGSYNRFHHVIVGSTRLRDAYFMIHTANYESAVVAVLNSSKLTLYDLRGYSFGGSRGVVIPDKVLDSFSKLLSSQGLFGVEARYPKLYKYKNHLLRISLVIEKRPDADRVRGVVFAEAANTRISGFVEYSYGESLEVFLQRLKESIDATYEGYSGGAQTQTAFVNGTVLRVGSFLTEYQGSLIEVFVFLVSNGTDEVAFLVHPAYVASMQEYYEASYIKEGDEVYASLRYVIELQARVAYTVEVF